MRRFPTLALLASLDLGIGFAVQIYMLASVGINASTDAYYAGQVIPVTVFAILQLPLQRTVLAVFARDSCNSLPILPLLCAISGGAFLLLTSMGLAAPVLFQWFFPGLRAGARDLAATIFHIQTIATSLMLAAVVLLPVNQLRSRFVPCEIANVCGSIASALFVVFAIRQIGILAAACGALIRAVVVLTLYWLPISAIIRWGGTPWRQLWAFASPLASAGALAKLAPIIDRSLASSAVQGSLTTLTFAQNIYGAATGLAERAAVAPLLPDLRRGTAKNPPTRVALWLAVAGAALSIFISGGAMLLARSGFAVKFISSEHIAVLATTLALLGGMAIGALSGQWLAAAVAVLGRPSLAGRVAIVGFLISVPLKLAGFASLGIQGLALAISAYYLLNALVLGVFLRKVTHGGSAC